MAPDFRILLRISLLALPTEGVALTRDTLLLHIGQVVQVTAASHWPGVRFTNLDGKKKGLGKFALHTVSTFFAAPFCFSGHFSHVLRK